MSIDIWKDLVNQAPLLVLVVAAVFFLIGQQTKTIRELNDSFIKYMTKRDKDQIDSWNMVVKTLAIHDQQAKTILTILEDHIEETHDGLQFLRDRANMRRSTDFLNGEERK